MESSYFATIQKDKYSFGKSPRFPEVKQKYCISHLDAPLTTMINLSSEIGLLPLVMEKKLISFIKNKKIPVHLPMILKIKTYSRKEYPLAMEGM